MILNWLECVFETLVWHFSSYFLNHETHETHEKTASENFVCLVYFVVENYGALKSCLYFDYPNCLRINAK